MSYWVLHAWVEKEMGLYCSLSTYKTNHPPADLTYKHRHPQFIGQGLWCAAHTLWVGNSFVLVASAFLMAHHLFG